MTRRNVCLPADTGRECIVQRQDERPHQCSSKQVGLTSHDTTRRPNTNPDKGHTKDVRKNVYVGANLYVCVCVRMWTWVHSVRACGHG